MAIPFPTMLVGHLIIPGGRHYIEKEGKLLDNYITCINIYIYIYVHTCRCGELLGDNCHGNFGFNGSTSETWFSGWPDLGTWWVDQTARKGWRATKTVM